MDLFSREYLLLPDDEMEAVHLAMWKRLDDGPSIVGDYQAIREQVTGDAWGAWPRDAAGKVDVAATKAAIKAAFERLRLDDLPIPQLEAEAKAGTTGAAEVLAEKRSTVAKLQPHLARGRALLAEGQYAKAKDALQGAWYLDYALGTTEVADLLARPELVALTQQGPDDILF